MSTQPKYIAYVRVSTKMQGVSGLGLEAQKAAIIAALPVGANVEWYTEIESGRNTKRPILAAAIAAANKTKATLIVAKLDRLGRNASQLLAIRDSGIQLVVVDMPNMDTLTFGVFAVVAQREAEMTSERTIAALAAKKERGQNKPCTNTFSKETILKGNEAARARSESKDNIKLMWAAVTCKESAPLATLRDIAHCVGIRLSSDNNKVEVNHVKVKRSLDRYNANTAHYKALFKQHGLTM